MTSPKRKRGERRKEEKGKGKKRERVKGKKEERRGTANLKRKLRLSVFEFHSFYYAASSKEV